MSLHDRLAPLASKLSGRARLCPWSSILPLFHPGTRGIRFPEMDVRFIAEKNSLHLLRFGGKHDFWFPRQMTPRRELWSEYLTVFFDHRVNSHYYLRRGLRLGPSDVVLDCGACEGFFTRFALENGVRKVICVEPSPAMVECLHASFESEIAEGRVFILPAALSSVCGEADFAFDDQDAFSGRLGGNGALRVELTTIDRISEAEAIPTFIKMDLEGAEYEALRGGAGLLCSAHPKLAVTTYHFAWDHAVTHSLLRGFGYHNFNTSAATLRESTVPRPVMLHAW